MNRYTAAIARMNGALDPIAKKYGRSKIFFWCDAMLASIRYGVTPNQYIGFRFYEKSGLARREFYTHRQHKRFERGLNDLRYYDTFWDKQRFNAAFADFIRRDWLYCAQASKEEVCAFLGTHKKVMVKPTSASSGRGIHVYAGEPEEELIESGALLEEFVFQHHKMSELNPTSVNTIRIYTILDSQNDLHILSASIRVGGKGSEVDNYHAGGVGYPLDPEHGVVMAAGRTITGTDYLYHPGTGAKMIGFEVPDWDGLLDFVSRAAQVFPTARMIAWDVAVLEDGFELIEGNYNGDPGFMQAPSNCGKRREILQYIS